MANLRRVSKGIYTSDSRPKKVDEARLREIIDRGAPQRQRRETPARETPARRENSEGETPSRVARGALALAR